jgi:acyl carrier protein
MEKQQEILNHIATHLGMTAGDIDMDSSLIADLELDPVKISELIDELQSKFGVTFSPTDIAGITTIEDLVILVEDLSLE